MPVMDAVLAKAIDVAREAAIEVAGSGDAVGDHLSAHGDSDRLLTHLFACSLPGYRGWVWSVTLSRAPRGKEAAVCEAHLVAADDALLSPPWVPWAERVQPGDIKPGMAVPRFDPDPRLEPGYTVTDSDEHDAVAIWELGLGRERVLGPLGRDEAAERWTARSQESGSASRDSSTPVEAVGEFVIPLAGSMRLHFGVCANKWCPFDGTVVPLDHACDGQSQSTPERSSSLWPVDNPVFDTDASVPLDLRTPDAGDGGDASVNGDEALAESADEGSTGAAVDGAATEDATATGDPAPTAEQADQQVGDQPAGGEPEAQAAEEPEPAAASTDDDASSAAPEVR
ncbi:DUF3027 domain-containing protein [Demequina sp. NBRC 110053]|uniref:DUF3027 domain-containing protein n=1 Tax=Demequina sp. NBRC 110053 TaxID=1570342 RepID=UPI0009FDA878|nr:DUF3027 domain-containing protein [Demequina sp. NBRC 110053]